MKPSQFLFLGLAVLGLPSVAPVFGLPQSSYHLIQTFPVRGEGRWDYISIDQLARRLYVSHAGTLQVLNADSGELIGEIPGGFQGPALAANLNRGFTGKGDTITIFDLKTLKVIKEVSVNGSDAILYDPFTKRVFPIDEKITVIDGKSGDKVGEVNLGSRPEEAVSDGKGKVYVNLVEKNAIAVINAESLGVTAIYPIDRCTSPISLSLDPDTHRLFVGCGDGVAVVDADNGRTVANVFLTCNGVDGGGFDREARLIFRSCGEGVVSIIKELAPDHYDLVDAVKTALYARTMVFDPNTKRIFLPTADFENLPTADPGKPYKRQEKPGSFRVLVLAP